MKNHIILENRKNHNKRKNKFFLKIKKMKNHPKNRKNEKSHNFGKSKKS